MRQVYYSLIIIPSWQGVYIFRSKGSLLTIYSAQFHAQALHTDAIHVVRGNRCVGVSHCIVLFVWTPEARGPLCICVVLAQSAKGLHACGGEQLSRLVQVQGRSVLSMLCTLSPCCVRRRLGPLILSTAISVALLGVVHTSSSLHHRCQDNQEVIPTKWHAPHADVLTTCCYLVVKSGTSVLRLPAATHELNVTICRITGAAPSPSSAP